jgi:hypothetical protein
MLNALHHLASHGNLFTSESDTDWTKLLLLFCILGGCEDLNDVELLRLSKYQNVNIRFSATMESEGAPARRKLTCPAPHT